jgi:hypothetical protein
VGDRRVVKKSLLDSDDFESRLPLQMQTCRSASKNAAHCAVFFRVVAFFLAAILLFWSPNVLGAPGLAESLQGVDSAIALGDAVDADVGPSLSAPDFWDEQEFSDPCEDAEEKFESSLQDEPNSPAVAYFALESSFSDVPVRDSTGRCRYRRDRARGPPVV